MKGLKISKNIKLKLFVLVTFLVLMFVQIGPYLLYADENELTFSYKRINLVATNEYYNSNNLFFSEAYIGQNPAYCLDYGVPLPVSSGGTVRYIRTLSSITTAALVYGYPYVSASSLGVNSEEEARLATQFAVWSLVHATDPNDSRKSDRVFDIDNLVATTGYEAYLNRVKTATRLIIARSLADPYLANPQLRIINNGKLQVQGDKIIAGPFKINGTGFEISDISVSLTNKPESAYLCDANGNAKSSFNNGDDIYVALNIRDQNTTIGLRVDAKGNHKVGKVYGTGNPNDAKQDYAFLTTLPDQLTDLADIHIPTITGGIKVLKTDQYNVPLTGVTFELRDTTGKTLQTRKTDANGVIEFSNLPVGKYVLVETSSLEGYIMANVPNEIEVTYNHTTNLTIINRKMEGGLKIIKFDEDKEKPLAGVTFNILDANKNVIDTVVTNNEGIAYTKKLAVGTYYFQEISAPSYIMVNSDIHEFEITKPNVTIVRTLRNHYTRGRLTIQKTSEDNKPIAGVTFKIYNANKELVETIVTDASGKATTGQLKHGTYYYQEVEAPHGYIVDSNMKEFTMEYTDKTINVTNEYAKGTLKIVKTGDNGKPLQGVVFEILDANKKVVDTITTNANGIATSKKLVLGTYYYREIKAPDNVIMDTAEYEFKLTQNNQVLTREIENELLKMGKLKIVKTDELDRPLEGVVFEILDANKKVVDTITTGKDGVAASKELVLGTYYYREKTVPSHVIIDTKEYEFKLTQNGQIVTKEIENKLKRGSLTIYKVDENGKYLENVTFTLLDENGKEIASKTTGKDGIVKFENLLPGKYNFKEVDAPVTVVPDKELKPIEITVDQLKVEVTVENKLARGRLQVIKTDEFGNKLEGVVFEILDANKKVIDTITTNKNGEAISKQLVLGTYYYREVKAPNHVIIDTKEYEFKLTDNSQVIKKEIENEVKRGSLSIFKVDENGKYLENVTFTLVDKNGNEIASKTTGKDGIVKFENLLPGKYNFKEVDAPVTVVADQELKPIEITVDQLKVEVTVENKLARGRLQIIKTDELGKKLEGVVFEILDANKKVIDTITTNKDGEAISKEFVLGKYYYREVKAPNGIVIDKKEYEFKLTENNQVIKKEIENELERGSLSIYKVDENGKYLENVTFTLIDENGKEIASKTTGKDGIVKFDNLLPGKYNFKETDAPIYVVADQELKPIEITVDKLKVEVTVENKFARGILKIHKTDMADKSLEGVTFEILDADKKVIETLVTDENGMAESQKLVIGKYYYREVAAKDENIIIDTKLKDFAVTEEGQIILKEIQNQTVEGVIVLTKIDSENKEKVLEGAKIEILDESKNVIATLTTDENGKAKLGNLKVGKYFYKEIEAPEGYILDSTEYEFSITKEAQLVNKTLKNEAKKLPQTGGFLSTNMLIVIIVTVVSVTGYIAITLIVNSKKEQQNK